MLSFEELGLTVLESGQASLSSYNHSSLRRTKPELREVDGNVHAVI